LGFSAHCARTRVFRRGVIIPTPCHAKTCGQTRKRGAGSSPGRIRRSLTCAARTIDNRYVARENPDSEERRRLGIPRGQEGDKSNFGLAGPHEWCSACSEIGLIPVRLPGKRREAAGSLRPRPSASLRACHAAREGLRLSGWPRLLVNRGAVRHKTELPRVVRLLRLRRPDSRAIGATRRSPGSRSLRVVRYAMLRTIARRKCPA